MKRVKISARLQKETEKALVFTSGSTKVRKGEHTTGMFSLPKSQITVIERNESNIGFVHYMIIDMPEWLFKKLPIHEPQFAQFINVM